MPKAKIQPVKLTDYKVDSLKAADTEYVQWDTQVPAFGVLVRPSGTRSYIVMKRLGDDDKVRKVTLGRVGVITLEEARDLARDKAKALRRGIDVNEAKRAERAQRQAAKVESKATEAETGFPAGSFGEIAVRYFQQECAQLRRGSEVEAIARRAILPEWGKRPIVDLRRRDLTALLDPIIADGKVQAAHKVREIAMRIMNWATDRGDIEVNYIASASRGRKRSGVLRRVARDRVLTDDELRAIWRATLTLDGPFGPLVRSLILLGQRRSEVAEMERGELDLDAGIWTIPPSRYKTGVAHAVPLPAAAVEIIKAAPRVCDRFVFATIEGAPFSGFSKSKARLDKLSGVTGWTLHDLRRTMRTGLSRLGVAPDIAERVVGHVVGGVRGVYDRHQFVAEKREALERWAAHVDGIVNPRPGKVVRMRRRAVA